MIAAPRVPPSGLLAARPGQGGTCPVAVLRAAMFVCAFHAIALARRDLLKAAAVTPWVVWLWSVAHPAILGLAEHADTPVPSLPLLRAAGILGESVTLIRRELRAPRPDTTTHADATPPAPGTRERQDRRTHCPARVTMEPRTVAVSAAGPA